MAMNGHSTPGLKGMASASWVNAQVAVIACICLLAAVLHIACTCDPGGLVSLSALDI